MSQMSQVWRLPLEVAEANSGLALAAENATFSDRRDDSYRNRTLSPGQKGWIATDLLRLGALVDQLELGIPAIAERLREHQTELVRLESEADELRNAVAGRTNRRASDALFEAISWWGDLSRLEGEELFAARAKANALLNEAFDWIMPIGDVVNDGVYIGAGAKVWWSGRVNGDTTPASLEAPETDRVTRLALDTLRGPLPALELPEDLRQAEAAERALDA